MSKVDLVRPAQKRRQSSKADPYYLRAVGKALTALEVLSQASGPLTLNELASRLKLTRGSTLRLLHTLRVHEYVERTEEGSYRRPQNSWSAVSGRLLSRLAEIAEEPLRALVREFRESVGLAVLFDNHIQVVSVIESPELVRMGNIVGRIIPPHASALGKCITAFQDEAGRERLLRSYGIVRFTPKTIVDEEELRQEYERIASRGYATDDEESTLHGYCIAAPVRAPDGRVIAAISISPPMVRSHLHDRQKMTARVIQVADAITEGLRRLGTGGSATSPRPMRG